MAARETLDAIEFYRLLIAPTRNGEWIAATPENDGVWVNEIAIDDNITLSARGNTVEEAVKNLLKLL